MAAISQATTETSRARPNATTDAAAPFVTHVVYSLQCLEASVIIASNVLTLVAIRRTRKLRAIPTNMFIASLAVTDGVTGVFVTLILALQISESVRSWTLSSCVIRGPYYTMFFISLSTLLAIAADRYVAVVHPLAYKKRMTSRRALTVAVVVWLGEFSLVMALTCYYGISSAVADRRDVLPAKLFVGLMQAVVLVPVAGNVLLYLLIYASLRKRNPVGSDAAGQPSDDRPSKRTRAFTKMMALVLGYLIVACLPYYVLGPLYDVNDPRTPAWYVYAFHMSVLLFYSNSFMNPVIYSWKNRDFREAYRKILKCQGSAATTRVSDMAPATSNVDTAAS